MQLEEIPVGQETTDQNNDWPAHPLKSMAIWAVSVTFFVMHFFLQLSFGVMATKLRETFLLDAFQLSLLSSGYFVMYVLLQIPAGMLIDRFGAKKLLVFGGVVCFVGSLLFASVTWFWAAFIARLLMGTGMSFSFIATINIAAKWFPPRHISVMIGLTEMAAFMGCIVGNLTLAKAISAFGWRQCYFVISIFLVAFTAITAKVLRDSPHDRSCCHSMSLDFDKVVKSLSLLLKSKDLWLVGIYSGLCYVVTMVYAALWCIPFLVKAHNFDNYTATHSTIFVYFGLAMGMPLVTWFFGKGDSVWRRIAMFIAPLILFICISYIIYFPGISEKMINTLHFILGFSSAILVLCYTMIPEIVPPRARSTGIGFINTLALLTAPVFQLLIGFILEKQSDIVSVNNIEFYTAKDYQVGLSIIPAVLIMAMMISLFIRPKQIFDEEVNLALPVE